MPKDPTKDKFDRRTVKKLDDISFEEEDAFENVKNLNRLPSTILTEDSLKNFLTKDLERLLLENHHWIKD